MLGPAFGCRSPDQRQSLEYLLNKLKKSLNFTLFAISQIAIAWEGKLLKIYIFLQNMRACKKSASWISPKWVKINKHRKREKRVKVSVNNGEVNACRLDQPFWAKVVMLTEVICT